jgi:hypothetical protein
MFGRRQWIVALMAIVVACGLVADALVANDFKQYINEDFGFTCLVPTQGWSLVAQEADLALGGIYNHFDSKEAIFKAVIVTYHPFLTVVPKLEHLQDKSTTDLLYNAARLFVQEMEQQRGLFNLMFIELIELDGRHMPELVNAVLPSMLRFQQRVMADHQESIRAQTPVTF